ncbi:hypothetical protein A2303_01025 [Candidatus Falkowbacteria bacterium RIFOXYB2_FULL_47_14]|uniref:Uncharacterized protein n=1 Tax=Candidatus Falkowbacteria bacterium RIFOXYA2_FULL_47_19 TaxID=1797994 RepID=A0A1F5SG32_9BACT|nr:MAG: hypothetical protein A2227_00225 [Candidatus Falkowbacteria bacterium RIFOXYA2_FULL_47_19]OGF35570.1 MAG: hypothetical protein A2468_06050 [Candidatus Falkowbacteria bacterium RIFOXYC2_FULL_46_15]OGF42947.1 MAG: hypothetical protein A2303_01025 [Candidatus Falkowbacteria bacterium RIFOXYB2_FULL_47_14]
MAKPKKEGKKNRKIGRAARKPAHTSYTRERRWETNKERRMARQAKFEAKKEAETQSAAQAGKIPA